MCASTVAHQPGDGFRFLRGQAEPRPQPLRHIGAELGMVIRSLIFDGEQVTIGVGGGITIDSDPVAELAETKLKAQALLNVLGLHDPTQVAW